MRPDLRTRRFPSPAPKGSAGAPLLFGVSLKDRSAVLPGGRKPDACYWFDKNGQAVTSTYYRDAPHAWVRGFNQSGYVDRWRGTSWDRLRTDLDYPHWSGPDDVKGESTELISGFRFQRTFPHPLNGGEKSSPAEIETCSPGPRSNSSMNRSPEISSQNRVHRAHNTHRSRSRLTNGESGMGLTKTRLASTNRLSPGPYAKA